MRILLVNAVNKNDFSYSVPLSIAYLTGYLKEHTRIKDVFVKSISSADMDKIEKVIIKYNPDLVGISATSPTFDSAINISRLIKKINRNIFVIVGGQHITLIPESLSEFMDFGVIGEGEQTFLELVEALEDKETNFSNISGICFKDNGRLVITRKRDLIENLDDVSHPERRLLNPTNNTLFSSRGCPYHCIFCSSSVIWERRIRFHSAKYIFDEIYELYKKGHSVQWFADDLFVCNKEIIKELVKLLKQKGLHKKIIFFAEGRSNLINDEIISSIKELNVFRISFGFESADNRVLKYAKGGAITVEKHIKASKICREHGILVDGYIMVGFPLDNPETLQKTYEFAANHCDLVGNPTLVTVFPKTQLREILLKETNVDYSIIHLEKFKQNSYLPVEEETICCKNLTKDEILNYKKKFKKLETKKKRKFYFKFVSKLIFSKCIHINIKYFLRNSFLRFRNPKREFISKTIKLT